MKTYHTASSEETQRLGEQFASELFAGSAAKRRGALVVVLSGELGAGKTTFVQGFFRAAGIRRRAQSPTFVLMRRYRIPPRRQRKSGIAEVLHLDAYRLKDAAQLAPLGFDALLADPKNLLLIEWGERIKDALPKGMRRLEFRHGKKEDERTIVIKGN